MTQEFILCERSSEIQMQDIDFTGEEMIPTSSSRHLYLLLLLLLWLLEDVQSTTEEAHISDSSWWKKKRMWIGSSTPIPCFLGCCSEFPVLEHRFPTGSIDRDPDMDPFIMFPEPWDAECVSGKPFHGFFLRWMNIRCRREEQIPVLILQDEG